MKIYIWKDLKKMSQRYHDSGGIVIIAESIERARQLATMEKWDSETNTEILVPIELPDDYQEFDCSATEEVFIPFPNAGCC